MKVPKLTMVKVSNQKVELTGPFECSGCGGHIMIDATFIEQVSQTITCPYCKVRAIVKEN